MIPGEILYGSGDITINDGAPRVQLEVVNTGDRPVQVGSHVHFAQSNAALSFDRDAAHGHRLDIPAGTAVRFEAGVAQRVALVPMARLRAVHGITLDPQTTMVAGGSRHASSGRLSVTGSGRVRLRKRVQIGRTDERQGFWSGSLHADVDGEPLLRHRIELGARSPAHDELGAPLAAVSELRYPDIASDALGTVLESADGGCLATWQGDRLGSV